MNKNNWAMWTMFVLISLFFLLPFSCSPNTTTTGTLVAERVFMHEKNVYSFYVKENNQLNHFYVESPCEWQIKNDVPVGKPCWAEWTRKGNGFSGYKTVGTIHIHDVKDINGASWDHGKFGHGQTVALD